MQEGVGMVDGVGNQEPQFGRRRGNVAIAFPSVACPQDGLVPARVPVSVPPAVRTEPPRPLLAPHVKGRRGVHVLPG